MGRKIVFNVTQMGASHVKSGKPCQDHSLSWESDDKTVQVAIVCDGHGGDTYVRSDVGSKLAAEIALSNIRNFIDTVSPAIFLEKSAAVTARPNEEEDDLFPAGKKSVPADLTESEIKQLEQDKAFYAAVENIREQDRLFCQLFACIYMQWCDAIQKDADDNPFTEFEKGCLKNAKIVKAYGTTLMAFVRTPLYWFAFHIGDGKMVACNRNMEWFEPVPWDCNCFLNMTTSLCNSNPIPMFRYAFSGKGDFPSAVILGSDGLDDSWVTMDNLQNFYSQTLSIFNDLGEEKAVKELNDYLPVLSQKGSRDDMSMAGIVDMDEIKCGLLIYNDKRQQRALKKKKDESETELGRLNKLKAELDEDIRRLTAEIAKQKEEKESWWSLLLMEKSKRESDVAAKEEVLAQKAKEIEQVKKEYEDKSVSYNEWAPVAKKEYEELQANIEMIAHSNEVKTQEDLLLWELQKNSFENMQRQLKEQRIKERGERMEQCNEEALKALEDASAQSAVDTEYTPGECCAESGGTLANDAEVLTECDPETLTEKPE
jgi:serine/threonine protein phosphatase PrpC